MNHRIVNAIEPPYKMWTSEHSIDNVGGPTPGDKVAVKISDGTRLEIHVEGVDGEILKGKLIAIGNPNRTSYSGIAQGDTVEVEKKYAWYANRKSITS